MNMQGILGTEKGNEIIYTIQNSEDKNLLDVYFGTRRLTSINKQDNEAKKILVAFLANAGIKKVAVSRAFSINPCLVTRYSKQFNAGGMSSLVKDERGRPAKVTEKLSAFVIKEYISLKKKRVKSIRPLIAQKVKERFGTDISKELIRLITLPVRENKPVLKEPPKDITPVKEDNADKLSLKLKKGFYSRYAGGLILNAFISRLTKGVLEGYSNIRQAIDLKTFMIMIIQMVSFDIINIERVKKIIASQFGLLMGLERSPEIKTARRKLAAAVESLDTENISSALALNYLDNLSCGTDLFYVDDHLDTYTGKAKVLSGFSHIYDRMVEGALHTFVHDRWGNPICFTLRDNFATFKDYLPIMAGRIKKMYKKKKLTFVFDRGGYDRKTFLKFDSIGSCYIVWAKGDKRDYSKEDLDFSQHTVCLKANTKNKPREAVLAIAELALEQKGQRRIVIRRKAERRSKEYKDCMYSSLVTNDMDRPAFEVVEAIIYRWRQECDFKIEKQEFGIDQITSYSMKDYKNDLLQGSDLCDELGSERMMASPMLKPLRYAKDRIKREISKIDEKMGKWTFAQTKKRDRTIKEVAELKRSQSDLTKREELLFELKEVEAKMALLPKKINRLEYLISKKFKVFDFRKKLIADTLKVCARNARKMALEVLDKHYHNYRDQLDFLKRIITNGGHVKLNDKGTVIAEITPFNTKKENETLDSFLKEINSMKPHMFGEIPYPIKFRVGKT